MKIPDKPKAKKDKVKKKEIVKPKKEQVLIVAQEIKFARLLSGNEKKTRDRVLKSLKKWISNCYTKGYEFKEDDFIRVWKGLFYAVWMSDKPLIQEELCEDISSVLDLFPVEHLRHALLMFKAGLRVLASEWYGLDQHRTDKFLMLVRRYLRASLRCLSRCEWSIHSCQMYTKILADNDGILSVKTPHYARNATSMILHVLDCYLEEIAKVSNGDIPEASLVELLRPVCSYMCNGECQLVCTASRRVLTALVRQSDVGLQYQEATHAWEKMGCPEGGPEALELVSDDDDDEQQNSDNEEQEGDDDNTSKPLDPRAGRVDVTLARLPVPATLIADMLRTLLTKAKAARYKRVKICLERFEQLSRSEYPLRVSHTSLCDDVTSAPRKAHKAAAKNLHTLEKKLISDTDELALRGLSRKHRKRLLAKSRAGINIVEELDNIRHKLPTNTTNGGWQVEPTEPEAKKSKPTPKLDKKRKNDVNNKQNNKKHKVNAHVNGDVTINDKVKKLKEGKVKNGIGNVKKVNKVKNTQNTEENGIKDVKSIENNLSNNSDKKIKLKNKEFSKETKQENSVKSVNVAENTTKTEKVDKKLNINKKENIALNGDSKKTVKKDKNIEKQAKKPTLLVNNKVKQLQKKPITEKNPFETPKKVKFVLKNNSMQKPVDYYKSVRQSPNIPFDSTKIPTKTNLKPSTPSPINPFFKKKLKLRKY